MISFILFFLDVYVRESYWRDQGFWMISYWTILLPLCLIVWEEVRIAACIDLYIWWGPWLITEIPLSLLCDCGTGLFGSLCEILLGRSCSHTLLSSIGGNCLRVKYLSTATESLPLFLNHFPAVLPFLELLPLFLDFGSVYAAECSHQKDHYNREYAHSYF